MSCTPCRMALLIQLLPSGSGQAPLRHPRGAAYRCYLPVLAGFTGSCRVGPNPPHHSTPVVRVIAYPRGGIQPRYSGFRVQGAATSPSSTTCLWYLIWAQKSNSGALTFLKAGFCAVSLSTLDKRSNVHRSLPEQLPGRCSLSSPLNQNHRPNPHQHSHQDAKDDIIGRLFCTPLPCVGRVESIVRCG